MPTARYIYETALGRTGMNFEDGLLGVTNPTGVLAALNGALSELSVDHDWLFFYTEEIFTTSAGQSVYPVPTDWLRTSFLTIEEDGTELISRQRRDHFGMADGPPRFYDTSGDRLLIGPTPDRRYRLVHGYFSHVPKIVENTTDYDDVYAQLEDTTIDVPTPFDDLVILYTAKNQALLQKDRAAYEMLLAEIKVFRSKIEDNRRRQQSTGRIKTRQDY
jgi:hypothetical protein